MKYILEMKDLRYGKFPYEEILQKNYCKTYHWGGPIVEEFKKEVDLYLHSLPDSPKTLETINKDILLIVDGFKTKYPKSFSKTGWYTKKLLVHAFEKGRLLLDGERIHPIEIEYEDKLRKKELKRLIQEEKVKIALEALDKIEREKEEKEEKEKTRLEVIIGMKIQNKEGVLRTCNTFWPKKTNIKVREIIQREYFRASWNRIYWEVEEILQEGAKIYLEDLYRGEK